MLCNLDSPFCLALSTKPCNDDTKNTSLPSGCSHDTTRSCASPASSTHPRCLPSLGLFQSQPFFWCSAYAYCSLPPGSALLCLVLFLRAYYNFHQRTHFACCEQSLHNVAYPIPSSKLLTHQPIYKLKHVDDGVSSPTYHIKFKNNSFTQNVRPTPSLLFPTTPLPLADKDRRRCSSRQHPRRLQYLFNPPLVSSTTLGYRATTIKFFSVRYSQQ